MGAPKITSLENGRCLVIHYDPYGRFFWDPRPSLDFHVMAAMPWENLHLSLISED